MLNVQTMIGGVAVDPYERHPPQRVPWIYNGAHKSDAAIGQR